MQAPVASPAAAAANPGAPRKPPSRRCPRGTVHLAHPSDPFTVYLVRPSTLRGHNPREPTVCAEFDKTGACTAGDECPRAHVSAAERQEYHAHVAPHHSLATTASGHAHRATQRRAPLPETLQTHSGVHAGMPLPVAAVEGAGPIEILSLGECLYTRALMSLRPLQAAAGERPLMHCAHYAGSKAICHFGEECRFVHAVAPSSTARAAVDAAAEAKERGAAPASAGAKGHASESRGSSMKGSPSLTERPSNASMSSNATASAHFNSSGTPPALLGSPPVPLPLPLPHSSAPWDAHSNALLASQLQQHQQQQQHQHQPQMPVQLPLSFQPVCLPGPLQHQSAQPQQQHQGYAHQQQQQPQQQQYPIMAPPHGWIPVGPPVAAGTAAPPHAQPHPQQQTWQALPPAAQQGGQRTAQ